MTTVFANQFVSVSRTDEGFSWYDLTDKWNGYSGYTKGKRGLVKADTLIAKLAADTKLAPSVKMGTITDIFESLALKPRTYCSID